MPTLFDPAARERILARVDRLTPAHTPLWGKMNVGQVVVHLSDQLRMGLGERTCAPKDSAFSRFPVKQLIVYLLPWPKGAPSAPELLGGPVGEFADDVTELRSLVRRFGERGAEAEWSVHPAFGRLSGRAWGVLSWRHLDHHLRQFGL